MGRVEEVSMVISNGAGVRRDYKLAVSSFQVPVTAL